MPWVVGETAEVLEAGTVRVGGGVATLSPPDQPQRVLPVPQGRVAVGLGRGVDAAVTYVPPLTGHVRLRARLWEGPRTAGAVAVGWGVHGVPDAAGVGELFGVPFATGGLQLAGRGAGPRWYGAVRAVVPYHRGRIPAATLWIAPQVGVELGDGPLRWGPELGAVIPTVHPEQVQVVLGVGIRWRR